MPLVCELSHVLLCECGLGMGCADLCGVWSGVEPSGAGVVSACACVCACYVFTGMHVCMHMGLDPCVCMLEREHICLGVCACEHVSQLYLRCWLAAWSQS